MIERNRHMGGYDVTCDFCSSEYLEMEVETFSDVINGIKDLGWRVFKDRTGEWKHECFECSQKISKTVK